MVVFLGDIFLVKILSNNPIRIYYLFIYLFFNRAFLRLSPGLLCLFWSGSSLHVQVLQLLLCLTIITSFTHPSQSFSK